ncbi:MAG: hypothetical protein KDC48_05310 [Planctomycetes bacterium]|nr:hypothetical protein [Planctomycetota bacterium]
MQATLRHSLAVAAFAAAALAQAPKPLIQSGADLVPTSAYAVLQFGGIERCAANTRQWPIAEMIGAFVRKLPAETREEHLDRGLEQAAEQVRRALGRAHVDPADLRDVLSCPMTVALGRPTIEGMGPSVGLLIETGNREAAVQRLLAIGEGALRRGGGPGLQDTKVGGVAAKMVQIPNGPPVFVAKVGGHLCLTNSRGLLTEVAAVQRGEQPALAQATVLGNLGQQLGAPPIASAYANTAVIARMLEPVLPYEAGEWADALGVGSLDALYAGFGATDSAGVDLVHIGLRGSPEGLVKSSCHKPADLGFANYCSENTVLFGVRSFDVSALIDAAQRFVQMLPQEAQREIDREFSRELTRELRHVGMTPADLEGMLRAFGDQMGLAIGLEAGAIPKPELLLRVGVRDRQTMQALLQHLEQLVAHEAGMEWKTRKVGDLEIRYFSLPIEDKLQLTPCYALTDDAVMVASDVMALTRSLRRAEEPGESLSAQDDFKAMAKEFAGANDILHVRAFRLAELGWRTVETLAYPQLDAHRDEIGFGSEALPDAETMAAALGSSTFACFVDERGITQRHRGLISIGSILATVGTLADEVLGRASSKIY